MKIRNGFVSNSSSSSFVVTMKNGEKLTKELLLEIFDVKKSSPLYSFADDLADWIMQNVREQNIEDIYDDYIGYSDGKSTEEMIDEIVEDYSGMDREELEKIASKEYLYYGGTVSSDSGEALEYYLYETDINIENDEIKIKSGY